MIEAGDLLRLIRDLDAHESVEHLEISNWCNSIGETDLVATRLVRQLAREKLGTFPLDDIGAAALAEIDARSADPS